MVYVDFKLWKFSLKKKYHTNIKNVLVVFILNQVSKREKEKKNKYGGYNFILLFTKKENKSSLI